MEIGAIVVGLILFTGGLFFVLKPFDKRGRRMPPKADTRLKPDEGRAAALSALRDLDFDFRTGKVSEEDYPSLRAQLVAEAAKYVELEKEEDERIEAMIRNRRASVARGAACRECGARLEAGARFCSHCGAEVGAACPSCGGAVKAADLFCPSCGARLEVRAEAGPSIWDEAAA